MTTHTYKMKRAAGVFAAFALACALVLPAPTAQAQSNADLQAQLNQLLAQLQQLQAQLGQGTSTSCPYTWTRDLSQGARGADVLALQRFLNSSADTRLAVSGAGSPGMETQYYGPITASAVSKFHVKYRAEILTPIGLVNPTGYFGGMSRAKANSLCSTYVPPTQPPASGELQGGEGYLDRFSQLGDVESVLDENDRNTNVLGVEFEARESDVRIERVDVEFDLGDSTGSSLLNRYISSVSLVLDGDVLETMNASEASRSGRVHSFRFTSLNGIVRENDDAELYVRVDAVSTISAGEEDQDIEVRIPARGIRAVSAAGISETYHSSSFSETFSISEQTQGDLSIREGNNNPSDGVAEVSTNSTTNNVTLLEFELEAGNQDITIRELPVRLESNGADVNEIIQSLRLMRGNTTVRSMTVSGAGDDRTLVFTNINETIDAGDEETYRVVADIRRLSGNFSANDTIMVSVTDLLAGWEIEDQEGDNIDPDGSAEGGLLTFLESGLSVSFVSSSENRTAATQSGQGDTTQYTITFAVTAGNDDIFIDRSTQREAPPVSGAGEGVAWATTTQSTSGVTNNGATSFTASGSNSGDTATSYRVSSGQTRNFTLAIALTATGSGFTAVELTGINYDTDSNTNDSNLYYTFGLEDFRTDPVFMQYNP